MKPPAFNYDYIALQKRYDALAQAKHDAKDGELPIVMHRKNNCEWVVIQPLDGWMQMYKEARG